MTHYEIQIAHLKRHASRVQILIQTPKILVFIVDGRTISAHEYDETGRCVSATWYELA